jgi:integrase/recombinase XerD
LHNGKRIWQKIGAAPDAALAALRNGEHDQQAIRLGRTASPVALIGPLELPPAGPTITVLCAKDAYLAELKGSRSKKTISAYSHILGCFSERVAEKLLTELTRHDLLAHMSDLREGGASERTIHNHIAGIITFLKSQGLSGMLKHHDLPRYDEKAVVAYSTEELAALFAKATAEERILFEFFLGTGFREQEVMYSTWANVDFRHKLISVYSKPEFDFRVKDKEERTVPVPDSLIAALQKRKLGSSSVLIFPTEKGKANGHMLRDLQRLALRAGLNCGECVGKGGHSCTKAPNCGRWGLHKFRKTFATMHSEAGVPARTIQSYLGHSDLATTLKYLALADLRSERTRNQINATFRELGMGSME